MPIQPAPGFSRLIASKVYNTTKRPYGYAFGGSGGAYRSGCSENAKAYGTACFVPFVLGFADGHSDVFCVRSRTVRLLHNKPPQIVDAVEPGSSDVYVCQTERQKKKAMVTGSARWELSKRGATKEASQFLVLLPGVVAADKVISRTTSGAGIWVTTRPNRSGRHVFC